MANNENGENYFKNNFTPKPKPTKLSNKTLDKLPSYGEILKEDKEGRRRTNGDSQPVDGFKEFRDKRSSAPRQRDDKGGSRKFARSNDNRSNNENRFSKDGPRSYDKPSYSNDRRGSRDNDKPFERRERRDDRPSGDRPFRDNNFGGGNNRGPRNFDKPFERRDDRPSGDRPFRERRDDRPSGNRPFRENNFGGGNNRGPRNFDKPFERRDDRPSGDRPFRERRDDRPSGDRPFRERRDDRPSGDRPFRENNFGGGNSRGTRNFDKPFVRRDDRPNGDRPYRERRDDRPSGDRPYRDNNFGGGNSRGPRNFDKPFERRDDRPSGNRPFRERRDDRSSGDRPFRERRDDRPSGDRPYRDNNDRSRNGENKFDGDRRENRGQRSFNTNKTYGESDRADGEKTYNKSNFEKKERVIDIYEDNHHIKSSRNKLSKRREEDADKEGAQMPLNKFVAKCGISSRREAVDIIKNNRVQVNGATELEPAYKVQETDIITLDGKEITPIDNLVYVLLNKPKDFITTTEDPDERKTVMDLVASATEERIYPIGRLDRNTTGLLLLTNDGDLAQKLSHPKYEIKKLYQVNLDKELSKEDFEAITKGLMLEDGEVEVDELSFIEDDKTKIGIQIHSGKNRIVRRIFESLGYTIKQLDRVMYANLNKKNLPRGNWRYLTAEEVRFLKYYNSK